MKKRDSTNFMFLDKSFLWFLVKFIGLFLLLYYGTLLVIGLAAPGGFYSSFVQQYLDFVSGIKKMLLVGTKFILYLFGISTRIEPGFLIRVVHGRGVFIAMDCVGYGVYSFWIAYVVANQASFAKKLAWVIGGIFLLYLINNIRIALFLLAINKGVSMPLGVDHHTWFNIFAYAAIFIMIYFFEKSIKRKEPGDEK